MSLKKIGITRIERGRYGAGVRGEVGGLPSPGRADRNQQGKQLEAIPGFRAKAGPGVKQGLVRSDSGDGEEGVGEGWGGGSLTSFLTFLPCFLQHLHTLADYFFQSYVLDFGEKPKTPTHSQ